MPPSDAAAAFLAAWHATAEQRSLAVLEPFVADDVLFSSPALFHPKRGKAEVLPLLQDVLASLEGYRVTRTWIDGAELLLEFEARVGERQLQGVDRISLDAAGRMAHLKVLIRPYHGLVAVMTAVGARQLDRLSLPARLLARARLALRRR